MDGRGCDANVKRSAGIAKPNHGDAAKLETQGGAEPRTLPQPRVQPTQATNANNNPGQKKGALTIPAKIKHRLIIPGMGKQSVTILGMGTPAVNNAGHGKTSNDNRNNYADAKRRYRHERHDHDWWKQHYIVIVLVGGGYYFQDSGYWYPAWGYDLNHERYDYDGPIYTYGNLLPDQVIINVQRALKDLGYYAGDLNGSLGVDTRQALSVYQQDYGLDTTGAVDEATVRALGLI